MEACLVPEIGSVDPWKFSESLKIIKLEDATLTIILKIVEN